MYIIDNKGAVAGGPKGCIDLVFAKDGSLLLSREKGKICIGVVDNIVPAIRVS